MLPYNPSDMFWTVLLPGLTLPQKVLHALETSPSGAAFAGGALALACQKARHSREPVASDRDGRLDAVSAWLSRDKPNAPLTALAALEEGFALSPGLQIWRADPVHINIARDHGVLTSPSLKDLTIEHAHALLESANAELAELGFTLRMAHPSRWYLTAEPSLTVQCIPPIKALGLSLTDVLPKGPDSARWRRALNRVQMAWHEHAVQSAREARLQLPVNALWLHGDGMIPLESQAGTQADPPFRPFMTGAEGLRTEGTPRSPKDLLAKLLAESKQNATVLLDGLEAPRVLEDWGAWLATLEHLQHEWLSPMIAMLHTGAIQRVTLIVPDARPPRRFELRRSDRLCLWRRRDLKTCFADEPA